MSALYGSLENYPLMLDAKDIQSITRLSRASTYELMNSDGFPAVRIGKRILVPRDDFCFWLEGKKKYKEVL